MIALSPIRAHRLTAEEFDEFLDRHPTVMKELLYRLLGEYSTLVSNFVAKQKGQAAPRVASFIIERSERVDGKLRFSRFCSVADIARFLGMYRQQNHPCTQKRRLHCLQWQLHRNHRWRHASRVCPRHSKNWLQKITIKKAAFLHKKKRCFFYCCHDVKRPQNSLKGMFWGRSCDKQKIKRRRIDWENKRFAMFP